MKRAFLLLLGLVACRDLRIGDASHALSSPAEAVDLDPDPAVVQVRLVATRISEAPLRYAYNGQTPGPTIRAKVGDTLKVELVNMLPAETTIHWHGIQVPWEMDGITWMQSPVMPGASFDYQFTLTRAGTYWYHPHFDTDHQVDAGLYGALIVEDPGEPRAGEELVLIFHDDTINGEKQPVYAARGGSTVRARMINVSKEAYLALTWPAMRVIGGDQGLLSALETPSRVLLAPGDRSDAEWSIGETGFDLSAQPYSLNGGDAYGDPTVLAHVEVASPAPAPAGLAWPFPGGEVTEDPGYADIVYAFAGSDRTERWLINGESFPNVTVEELALGSDAIIEVRNLSPTEHPFHIHGLAFEVLSINGVAPLMRTIEDTFNVRIRERVRLKVHADNPGEWMTHCHILPHQEEGMMTVLRVH